MDIAGNEKADEEAKKAAQERIIGYPLLQGDEAPGRDGGVDV
jgi:hypothetical protein